MVSTRKHPNSFSTSERPEADSIVPTRPKTWSHTPSNLTILWLSISIPLVIWDFSYVALRPHSMPGGKWHFPWTPYAIYCDIDLVYGFRHYEEGEGFNPAQSTLNFLETCCYIYYLYLVRSYNSGSVKQGRGAPDSKKVGWMGAGKKVEGSTARKAVLIGFGAAVATFSKTVLYWLVEILGGYKNIGHNPPSVIFWLWVMPNGPWIFLPAYMMYVFGTEILEGLAIASGDSVDELALKEE